MGKKLSGTFYLILSKKGVFNLTGRMCKKKPSLKSNEVLLRFTVEVPEELFIKPQLVASIVIPKDSVSQQIITAEMTENIRDAIKSISGFDLNITVTNPED